MAAVYEQVPRWEIDQAPAMVAVRPRRYALDYLIVGALALHGAADLYAVWVALSLGVMGDWLVVRLLSWPIVVLTLLFLINVRRRRRPR